MATIRIDDNLKKAADEMFGEVGMTTNSAVKIFLTRFVTSGKFPFAIEVPEEQPNAETLAAFEETKQIVAKGNTDHKESLSDYQKRMRSEHKNSVTHA
ncbi:MAG: type II toxin-antitoxin system RelB/DinJ family antitoxin [Lactobacillus sp.]|jgi:DNA-damage-inducible protein J|nr:type II toxin-antitoxin system RelB/DinJ family antitoxin [Lactobacillus sp.]